MVKYNKSIPINEVSIDIDGTTKLDDLLKQLTAVREHVPIEYWDNIEIHVESDYDSSYTYTTLFYLRPETDEEEKLRLAQSAAHTEQLRAYKRRQLEALKKELGE